MDESKLLTIEDVAKQLQCNISHVSRLISSKRLVAVNIGNQRRKRWRVRPEDLDAFFHGRTNIAEPLAPKRRRRPVIVKQYV